MQMDPQKHPKNPKKQIQQSQQNINNTNIRPQRTSFSRERRRKERETERGVPGGEPDQIRVKRAAEQKTH